jgi:hypothetical protein
MILMVHLWLDISSSQNVVFIFISYKNIILNNYYYFLMLIVSYSIIDNTKNVIKNYILLVKNAHIWVATSNIKLDIS